MLGLECSTVCSRKMWTLTQTDRQMQTDED